MSELNPFDPKDVVLPTQFVGKRILCRPFHADDARALLEIYRVSREHLIRALGGVEDVRTIEDAAAAIQGRISAWNDRIDLAVAIFDKQTEFLLGESGLGADWDARTFELGFWLSPSAEGHGYMAEANRLMCNWAFAQLSARRIVMQCSKQNKRSMATAERIGLRRIAVPATRAAVETSAFFEMTADDYAQAPWKA